MTIHARYRMKFFMAARARGFTLIELIMAVVLVGLLAAVGTTMIGDSFDTTYMVNANQASVGRARYALERLEREIREANGVTASSASSFTFTKLNLDGTTSAPMTATSGGGDLTLDGVLLIDNDVVANAGGAAVFSYYDKDGNATADNLSIHFVQVYLTVRDATSGQSLAQRTRIALRNAS